MYTKLWLHALSTRENWVAHINWMNGEKLEAAVRRCSVKKMFLKISQNSQEKIFTSISFLIKLQA